MAFCPAWWVSQSGEEMDDRERGESGGEVWSNLFFIVQLCTCIYIWDYGDPCDQYVT